MTYLITFVVTASGMSYLGIGAAFWEGGYRAAKLLGVISETGKYEGMVQTKLITYSSTQKLNA
ncbi:benzoate/H(+) symporter BenE family transporter [Amphritea sp. ZJ14W]|uniref:Benzoate/H(+) symporter BenE family transporter n=1 Tax=Amphritea pacifica TaxID=2811233 RepID=A0ABS2W3N6_9GAMM|nr:benzoate/H(+) symporter BenE family transporter [Amphritea pacifica]MBN1007517.1 benzoate/H(+) symporter BenE family transporter [Amphritea pacifica]